MKFLILVSLLGYHHLFQQCNCCSDGMADFLFFLYLIEFDETNKTYASYDSNRAYTSSLTICSCFIRILQTLKKVFCNYQIALLTDFAVKNRKGYLSHFYQLVRYMNNTYILVPTYSKLP
ncbi:unnamed protein product [Meganyctiphanes norvegica]|uniref:Secreted protein n=1 Tax=Meganyctiphanes norvegica TaxID=48144 RepID=A0AAV2RB60_MEGNR